MLVPTYAFIGKILDGGSIGDAVKQLYPDDNVKSVDATLYSVLQIIPILSESIRDTTGKGNWIDLKKEFEPNILNKNSAKAIFFGLLYEEMKNISFRTGNTTVTLKDIIVNNDAKLVSVEKIMEAITDAFKNLSDALTQIRKIKATSDSVTFDQIVDLIGLAAEDSKTSLLQVNVLVGKDVIDDSRIEQLYAFIPPITAIIKSIYSQDYSAAAMNSYLLITEFVQKEE